MDTSTAVAKGPSVEPSPTEKPSSEAPETPSLRMPMKKEGSAAAKQTPSLTVLDEEEEKVEEKVEEEVHKDTPFDEKMLLKVWEAYFEKRKGTLAGIESMVLKNKPILREDYVLELAINNGVEINILKKMEEDLLWFLRNELNNTEISISHVQKEQEEGENLYTDLDKFNDMAKRNPVLLQLKERLGLDTDY